jgi:hypothetical protein
MVALGAWQWIMVLQDTLVTGRGRLYEPCSLQTLSFKVSLHIQDSSMAMVCWLRAPFRLLLVGRHLMFAWDAEGLQVPLSQPRRPVARDQPCFIKAYRMMSLKFSAAPSVWPHAFQAYTLCTALAIFSESSSVACSSQLPGGTFVSSCGSAAVWWRVCCVLGCCWQHCSSTCLSCRTTVVSHKLVAS